MCYSAQVESKWKRYVRDMEARLSWPDFHDLAQPRMDDPGQYRLPRGFDLEFNDPKTDEELAIKGLVDQYRQAHVTKLEMEVFAQKKRLADADRELAVKETKLDSEVVADKGLVIGRGKTVVVQAGKRKFARVTVA